MLQHLAEELVDPEPHPFLAQKPVHRIQPIGEGEDETRLGVPAGGRQIGAPLGEGHEIGVEGQHEVVVVSLRIRRGQGNEPRAGPIRRAVEEALADAAEEGDRDPAALEHLEDFARPQAVFDGKGGGLALERLFIAPHQAELGDPRCCGLLDSLLRGHVIAAPFAGHAAPFGIDAEIQELNPAMGNDGDRPGVVTQRLFDGHGGPINPRSPAALICHKPAEEAENHCQKARGRARRPRQDRRRAEAYRAIST